VQDAAPFQSAACVPDQRQRLRKVLHDLVQCHQLEASQAQVCCEQALDDFKAAEAAKMRCRDGIRLHGDALPTGAYLHCKKAGMKDARACADVKHPSPIAASRMQERMNARDALRVV
jgi:hypothetical protein